MTMKAPPRCNICNNDLERDNPPIYGIVQGTFNHMDNTFDIDIHDALANVHCQECQAKLQKYIDDEPKRIRCAKCRSLDITCAHVAMSSERMYTMHTTCNHCGHEGDINISHA